MPKQVIAVEQLRRGRPGDKGGIDAVVDDGDVIRADPELGRELAAAELASHHHAIGGLHHPLLDEPVQRARVEVVVVRDHRDVEVEAPPRDEGARPDVAERVRAQEVEGALVPDALDGRGHDERRDPPPQSPANGKAVDGPVGHALGMRLEAYPTLLYQYAISYG